MTKDIRNSLDILNEVKNPVTTININDNTYTDITREKNPNEKYDNDDTYTSHDIESFSISKNKYGELRVGFVPQPGTTYYLLYVIYSTGDSFTYHEGEITYIDLYQDPLVAQENKNRILADEDKDSFSLKLQHESDKEYTINQSWKGHFERIQSVEIESIQLKL